MELAQSLVLFSHCCCPMALWLPAMELPQCRRVWANEILICNSNHASASEEKQINPQSYLSVQWSSYWRTRAVGSPYVTERTFKQGKRNNFKERSGGEGKKKSCDSLPLLRYDLLATALHNARKHIFISKPALLPLSFMVLVPHNHALVSPFLSSLQTLSSQHKLYQ